MGGIPILNIDSREVTEHPELLSLIKVPYTVQRLEAADYAFLDRDGEPFGIERCEVGNLVQKMRSGELESQLYHCQDNYSKVVLLTEGVFDDVDGLLAVHKGGNRGYFRAHIYPHTTYEYEKALEIRLSELGIEVLSSANFRCSMTVVETIYKQRTKPEEAHTLFKRVRVMSMPTKLTNNPAVSKLLGLCSRLPEKVAIQLINKYESIWSILNTSDEELLLNKGFGKGLLEKLKKGVGK